jgi:hypothetical protein
MQVNRNAVKIKYVQHKGRPSAEWIILTNSHEGYFSGILTVPQAQAQQRLRTFSQSELDPGQMQHD